MVHTQHSHRPPLRPVLEAYASVTGATYTAKGGDHRVFRGINRAGTVAITLPSSEVRPGRVYTVKDESGSASSNNITVSTEGSEAIDGSATHVISDDYGSKSFFSDGTNWFVVPVLPTTSSAPAGADYLVGTASGILSAELVVGTWATPTVDPTHSDSAHHAHAHQADHNSGGADALKLDDLAAPDDNTDLDFSTSAHGLIPKGTGTGDSLKDDGSWDTPSGSALQSTVVSGNRTAAAGSGDQAVTGAGFTPTAVIALCADNANQAVASWGVVTTPSPRP